MIKADLAATAVEDENGQLIKEAVPYVDDAGRYADFHSLRHTTGSLLAASGVHPKVAQAIMRHSNIDLTMSRYTHIFRGQESEAIAKLPDLSLSSRQSQKATGTDSRPVIGAYKKLAKKSDFDGLSESSAGNVNDSKDEKINETGSVAKSLQKSYLGTSKAQLSPSDIDSNVTTPGRTRTCDLRIRNPLLYPTELRALLAECP
jgi:hypothetical protein